MTDEADRAAQETEAERAAALRRARGARVPDASEPGPELCEVCEEPIGEGRRQLGHRDCLECAQDRERRNGEQ